MDDTLGKQFSPLPSVFLKIPVSGNTFLLGPTAIILHTQMSQIYFRLKSH